MFRSFVKVKETNPDCQEFPCSSNTKDSFFSPLESVDDICSDWRKKKLNVYSHSESDSFDGARAADRHCGFRWVQNYYYYLDSLWKFILYSVLNWCKQWEKFYWFVLDSPGIVYTFVFIYYEPTSLIIEVGGDVPQKYCLFECDFCLICIIFTIWYKST